MSERDLTIRKLTTIIMDQAGRKGFGTVPDEVFVPEKIALIHAETSEAYEAYRHNKMEGPGGFREELADVAIRLFHLCGVFGIDIQAEMLEKLRANEDRDWDWGNMNESSPFDLS